MEAVPLGRDGGTAGDFSSAIGVVIPQLVATKTRTKAEAPLARTVQPIRGLSSECERAPSGPPTVARRQASRVAGLREERIGKAFCTQQSIDGGRMGL